MRGPSANSPLEKLLQAALLKAGISFSTQRVLLGRYCVDILIDQKPVIIEADGAFHHLRKEKDARRDADLLDAGKVVFRFTGSQINADAVACVHEVIEAAGLIPDAEPVADIRTGMMGPENPNWTGGPQTVTCTFCGAESTRNVFRTQQKKMFCNSKCYGAWLRAHPEESNRRLRIDWSDLPELWAQGVFLADLAERYGCGKKAVRNQVERMGLPARRPGRPASRKAIPAR